MRMVRSPKFPQGIPDKIMRELKTLASALEHIAKGEMSQLGDILVQRLKAVELGLGGDTAFANTIRLVGLRDIGLTDFKEVAKAQKFLKNELKFQERRGGLG